MSDNLLVDQPAPIGQQIRRLRRGRAWTLAELARRAETSAPTLHRYENGWDRFELATLRKIATALGARLEVRLVPLDPTDPGWDEVECTACLEDPAEAERTRVVYTRPRPGATPSDDDDLF